jgi:hypothetical protein
MNMGAVQEPPVLTAEEKIALRDQQVAEKFDAVDLWDAEVDSLNRARLHRQMFSLIGQADVLATTERTRKAVIRGTLVRSIVSDVPAVGSDEYKALDEIGQMVAKEVTNMVWREVKPYQESGLAALARAKGKILVKTEISVEDEAVPACYITSDPECISQDFRGPLRDKVRKESERYALNMSRVAKVLPKQAESIRKDVSKDMKSAGELTKNLLALEAGNEDGE